MSVKKIAVIGAGNGGHTMAAHKTLNGFEVSLFELPRFADNVRLEALMRRTDYERERSRIHATACGR